jgi:hypothetical protein
MMNCFGARQGFVGFWQRTMGAGDREAFVAHLESCQRCDRSFRIFALTAPVLHAKSDPMVTSRASSNYATVLRATDIPRAHTNPVRRSWWTAGVGGTIAAALMAVYVAAARPSSSAYALEQTIIGDDSGVELTSFTTGGELFGQDNSGWQDSNHTILQEPATNSRDDLAG